MEVPLIIESVQKISNLCEESIFQLPEILSQEDKINYESSKRKSNNFITRLQNDAGKFCKKKWFCINVTSITKCFIFSEFVTSQCHILTTVVNPLCVSAEHRLLSNGGLNKQLAAEKERLLKLLNEKSEGMST